jgi:hypothetical protein
MHDLSWFMRLLKQRFARWYNAFHKTFGTLWAERFTSVIVEGGGEALLATCAYVDLNPVRAKLVSDPKDYQWSGYGEAVGGKAAARKGWRGRQARLGWMFQITFPFSRPCRGGVECLIYRGFPRSSVTPYHLLTLRVIKPACVSRIPNSTLLNFVSGAEKNEKRTKKEEMNESYEFFRLFPFFSAHVTKWELKALAFRYSLPLLQPVRKLPILPRWLKG